MGWLKGAPYFSYEIIDSIPSHRAVGNTSPPTHEVRRGNVGVGVEMIRDGDFVVLEGWCDETYAEP